MTTIQLIEGGLDAWEWAWSDYKCQAQLGKYGRCICCGAMTYPEASCTLKAGHEGFHVEMLQGHKETRDAYVIEWEG